VVSGMGGNAGAQAMAVAIRGIALGEGRRRILWRVIAREAIIGVTTGVVIGMTSAAFASAGIFGYREHPYVLGGVICAALIVNQFMACTSGVAIPFIMKGMGFDPAQSATIFATTVTDCCGFFATLGIAQLCMPWLKSISR
jgi:magnesium transporter